MSDGIDWISDDLGDLGFALTMVRGIGHEELAVLLGAQAGTVMDPVTTHAVLEASRGAGQPPDCAMLGETGDGWAFAIEPPWAPYRADRLAPGREMWSRYSVVGIEDTGQDPPTVFATVDGAADFHYFWGEVHGEGTENHPLTRRMAAEIGLGGREPDPDFPDDPEEWGLFIPEMRDVYRLLGEHYGLTLPRQAIAERRLAHAFTEPRVRVRPLKPCPVCGEQLVPWGGGAWGPGDYRLVCVHHNLPGKPGHPAGCPGELSGPALAGAVQEEPNPRYDNVRTP
ncbi:hypothetical protein [Streptomyces sp. NPDC018031]|uniref:hypothetical protein n=1 Tax=Streptomyces sp. NPDC018031 TaxID=3365033 RepID=UPI0037B9AF8A